MKFAVVLAFALAAAPIAYAQQQGTNPGNTKKDSDTADAQHNAPSGQKAVDDAKQQENERKSTAQSGSNAPAANQELSTDQVRQEKKKGMTRARALKQQREEKGTRNWNTLANPKTDQSTQSGQNASGVSQPATSSGGSSGTGAGGAGASDSAAGAGGSAGSSAPASGGSGR